MSVQSRSRLVYRGAKLKRKAKALSGVPFALAAIPSTTLSGFHEAIFAHVARTHRLITTNCKQEPLVGQADQTGRNVSEVMHFPPTASSLLTPFLPFFSSSSFFFFFFSLFLSFIINPITAMMSLENEL